MRSKPEGHLHGVSVHRLDAAVVLDLALCLVNVVFRAEAESSMDPILISNAENPYNLISRSVMHHGSFAK